MNKEKLKNLVKMATMKSVPIPTKPGIVQKKTNYLDTFCGAEESRIMFRYRLQYFLKISDMGLTENQRSCQNNKETILPDGAVHCGD